MITWWFSYVSHYCRNRSKYAYILLLLLLLLLMLLLLLIQYYFRDGVHRHCVITRRPAATMQAASLCSESEPVSLTHEQKSETFDLWSLDSLFLIEKPYAIGLTVPVEDMIRCWNGESASHFWKWGVIPSTELELTLFLSVIHFANTATAMPKLRYPLPETLMCRESE